MVLDSEIPSRALVTINKIAPHLSIPFAIALLKARYIYGKDFNLDATYAELIADFEIDEKQFFTVFRSEDLRHATQDAYKRAASYASSYPTMLIEKDGQLYFLEKGYASYNELRSRVLEVADIRAKLII